MTEAEVERKITLRKETLFSMKCEDMGRFFHGYPIARGKRLSIFSQVTPIHFSLKFSSSQTLENLLWRLRYVWPNRAIFRFY